MQTSSGNSSEKPQFAWFYDGLDGYLERMGLKQTQPRRAIVQVFLEMDAHVDAEELHQRVRIQGFDIGLATIYRTLNLLTEAGLVEQKSFQDGRSEFEIVKPDMHHDHLICRQCRRMIEFENQQIETIQEEIASKYGMKLKSHRLDLFGLCLDTVACRKRKNGLKP